jgi:hypothetical protein
VYLIHKISAPIFKNIRSCKAGSKSWNLPFYACHALLLAAQGICVHELARKFPSDFHGIASDISGGCPAGCPLKFPGSIRAISKHIPQSQTFHGLSMFFPRP